MRTAGMGRSAAKVCISPWAVRAGGGGKHPQQRARRRGHRTEISTLTISPTVRRNSHLDHFGTEERAR